jgi:O-antigen biosynthesis protein WbqP
LNKLAGTLGDRLIGLIFLILMFPIFLVVYGLLRGTSNPPLIIVDQTVIRGATARTFRFRTTGPGTPAFRSIGRFLRRWRIDELPSLWNVFWGEVRLMDLSMWHDLRRK